MDSKKKYFNITVEKIRKCSRFFRFCLNNLSQKFEVKNLDEARDRIRGENCTKKLHISILNVKNLEKCRRLFRIFLNNLRPNFEVKTLD